MSSVSNAPSSLREMELEVNAEGRQWMRPWREEKTPSRSLQPRRDFSSPLKDHQKSAYAGPAIATIRIRLPHRGDDLPSFR